MNEIIRNTRLKGECKLFNGDITFTTFENCTFDQLILSDIKFENVDFVNCMFDHVFMESFYAKNILISNCEILSLSLRGIRKITGKKLFNAVKVRVIENVRFENTDISELVLGGDLQVINCLFPKGETYLHFKNPYLVYTKCMEIIEKSWEGEKKRIGMIQMEDALTKEVKEQTEDFVVYSDNEYLENDVNEILKSVFLLIGKVSTEQQVRIS